MSDKKKEITLSIEETNKLRAEIGLKPLKDIKVKEETKKGSDKNPVSYQDVQREENEKKEKDRKERKRRLHEEGNAQASTKDVYREGLTMDDALERETNDTASWLASHRSKKTRVKKNREEEEGEHHMSDLRVAHEFEKFQEGEDITMVLADTPILNERGEINLDDGELENVLWKDQNKSKKWNDIKDDPARAGYNASLPDQYEIGAGGLPVKRLLTQYDDKPIEERGFHLGQRQAQLEALTPEERLNLLSAEAEQQKKEALDQPYDREGVKFNLNHGQIKFQSDYIPTSDAPKISFKKTGKKNKKKRKVKEEEEPKQLTFKTLEKPENIDSDEEDPELYEYLRKQRKVVNLEPIEEKRRGGATTKELVDKARETDAVNDSDDEGPAGMTITATTQFCKSVETAVEKVESLKAETYEGANMYKAQVQQKRKQMRGVKIKPDKKDKAKEKEKEAEIKAALEADSDPEDAGMAETPLDMTIGSALEYLRARDQIGNDQDTARKRNKEHRPLETSTDDNEIKLEYRDKFGRVQNAKEAFRTISWKFHGKMPGHKNYERRLQRYEREMTLRSNNNKELPTQRALSAVQKQEHKPHMVLGAEK